VRKFDLIITVSEFSKRSILEFADRYRIEAPPIYVTYQGSTILPSVNSDRSSRNYVLHFASKAPHKKTNWLLQEWGRLQASGVSLPPLRLIGDLDFAGRAVAEGLRNIVASEFVDRQEIGNTIGNALALILPSEIEGFGLPALEAYYCETPVVYVAGTAVEEVLGLSAPGGFRLDDNSFSVALHEALALDTSKISEKRVELEQRFSWSDSINRTIEAYQNVAG
jgi:glycosyltransferase involved in cell wall biosynthesis